MTTPVPAVLIPTTVVNFGELAMRTASDVAGTFNVDPNYVHAAMGIMEEYEEMLTMTDYINQCEELVDIAWFVALGLSTIPAEFILFNVFDREQRLKWAHQETIAASADWTLNESVNNYFSSAKRLFAYGQSSKNYHGRNYATEFATLNAIMHNVIEFFDEIEATGSVIPNDGNRLYECFLDRVIQKLRVRYPDKFNVKDATNRDLDSERLALEGGQA